MAQLTNAQRSSAIAAALLALALPQAAEAAPARSGTSTSSDASRPSGGLRRFRSDGELKAFLTSLREDPGAGPVAPIVVPAPVPPPAPPAPQSPAPPGTIVVTGTRIQYRDLTSTSPLAVVQDEEFSITNSQEAGVDEGGIVKVRGDTLIILRRGRLFTVSMAGGELRAVASIDAYPPGVSGRGDWYDEMLVSGDRVIVIGYSYARGGTEINRFRLGADGSLRFEDAYHLRSNDYYSSRNYASRLIGNRLIIYTPLDLDGHDDPLDALPGLRRWRGDNRAGPFQRIAAARDIYKPPPTPAGAVEIDTLHTVMDCDVTAPTLACSAAGVLGPRSRSFYVSGSAVYLWTADERSGDEDEAVAAFMYRLPLDRGRPAAIGVRGAPIDQFSFREDLEDGLVNVLVRSEGGGDAMWRPEVTEGDVALLRLPIRAFGDGSRGARRSLYRPLPKIAGSDWNFHNRFVGRHLLYGAGAFGDRPERSPLVVVPLRGGPVAELDIAHAIDRIEIIGRDALVVGSNEDALGFSAIELDRRTARVGDLFQLPGAAEGETRSHAFFFSPESADGSAGLLGLPIARAAEPAARRFTGNGAAMLFLSRRERRFAPAG